MPVTAISLLIFCILAEIARELCFKLGVAAEREAGESQTTYEPIFALWKRIWISPIVVLGCVLWLLEVIGWVLVLECLPLHVAFPIMSLCYVGLPFASRWALKESITRNQWVGTLLVALGVAFIGFSGLG